MQHLMSTPFPPRTASCEEGITISVLKAISFSRVDRCEKCLSFSNSRVRWYLAGADRRVRAGGGRARLGQKRATHQWRNPLRAAVDTTGQSLAAAACLTYLLRRRRRRRGVRARGRKRRGARPFLGSRGTSHLNTRLELSQKRSEDASRNRGWGGGDIAELAFR